MFAVPFLRSMRTRSPSFSSASPPPTAASGEGVEDRRRARRAGLPSVADAGQGVDAALQQIGGGCMFTTSALPG